MESVSPTCKRVADQVGGGIGPSECRESEKAGCPPEPDGHILERAREQGLASGALPDLLLMMDTKVGSVPLKGNSKHIGLKPFFGSPCNYSPLAAC